MLKLAGDDTITGAPRLGARRAREVCAFKGGTRTIGQPPRLQIRQRRVRGLKANGFRHKRGRLWRGARECPVSLERDQRRHARYRYGIQLIAKR